MSGAVLLPCWLFGLRCPSTGAYRLLCGAPSWWKNGSLQECSCHWVLPRTTTANVFVPSVSHNHPLPPQETLQFYQLGLNPTLMRSLLFSPCPGAHETLCVASKSGVSVSPSLVEFLQSNTTGLQSDSLEAPPPIARPPGWGAWCGAQNFHSCGRTFVV